MATSDKSKREANMAAAAYRQPSLSAVQLLSGVSALWARLGIPDVEKEAAMRWAGSIERLYEYLNGHANEVARIRAALHVTPMNPEIVADIVAHASGKVRDGSTPLTLAREYGIPLEVVLYYCDEQAHAPVVQRPWSRRFSR